MRYKHSNLSKRVTQLFFNMCVHLSKRFKSCHTLRLGLLAVTSSSVSCHRRNNLSQSNSPTAFLRFGDYSFPISDNQSSQLYPVSFKYLIETKFHEDLQEAAFGLLAFFCPFLAFLASSPVHWGGVGGVTQSDIHLTHPPTPPRRKGGKKLCRTFAQYLLTEWARQLFALEFLNFSPLSHETTYFFTGC